MKILLPLFLKYDRGFLPVALALALIAGMLDGVGVMLVLPTLKFLEGEIVVLPDFLNSIFNVVGFEPNINNIFVVIALAIAVKSVVVYSQRVWAMGGALEYEAREKKRILSLLLSAEWQCVSSLTTGYINNVLFVELLRAREIYVRLVEALASCIFVAVYFGVAVWVSLDAFLVIAVFSGPIALLYLWVNRRIAKTGQNITSGNLKSNQSINAVVDNIKYVKSTASGGKMSGRIDEAVEVVRRSYFNFTLLAAVTRSSSEPIAFGVLLLTIFYGRWAGLALSELVLISFVFFRLYTKAIAALLAWQDTLNRIPALEDVERLAEVIVAAREEQGQVCFECLSDRISFKEVTFSYPDGTEVLLAANFDIPANKTTAFIGPSGAGKSTLIDLVIGLRNPVVGTIELDGVDLKSYDRNSLRRRIGLIQQQPMLFDDSVENNIKIHAPFATLDEVRHVAKLANADDFIMALPDGYQTGVGEGGNYLSGGQRQRVALARALLGQPEILILDEATSALDYLTEREIKSSLAALRGSLTIIIVAHRLSTIDDADIVYKLEDGKVSIVGQGEFAELRRRAN